MKSSYWTRAIYFAIVKLCKLYEVESLLKYRDIIYLNFSITPRSLSCCFQKWMKVKRFKVAGV